MPEALSATAKKALENLGVEVRLGTAVTDITPHGVTIGSDYVAARTVIWGAGVAGSPAGSWLKSPVDRAVRVVVSSDFSVPGHADIFVVGDTASYKQKSGAALPGVAPAAKQAGIYAAQTIAARITYGRAPKPFRYRDSGNLATIGRNNALADFGWLRLSGLVGWLLWSAAHVYFLIGFRNRAVVAGSWALSYATYQRGARLITGQDMQNDPRLEEAA
jgi:NADH dehydrogenase